MENQELLQAIGQMMDEKLQPIKDDLAVLKEEAAITRHSTNILLKWAERAERTINVGLYNGDSN